MYDFGIQELKNQQLYYLKTQELLFHMVTQRMYGDIHCLNIKEYIREKLK